CSLAHSSRAPPAPAPGRGGGRVASASRMASAPSDRPLHEKGARAPQSQRPRARESAAERRRLVHNLLWLDRRKCLLLTHAGTLFPVFVADVRAADLRPPGSYI